MKVAILTQPLGHNYGGLLQAYALQTYLKSIGCEVETIDRRRSQRKSESLKEYLINFARIVLGRIKSIPTSRKQAMVFQNLVEFRDRNLVMSPRITTERELRAYFEKRLFDAVIVGSDQVWRPRYSPSILNFYLDFLNDIKSPAKRIAYAASFGVDQWEYPDDISKKCSVLAKQFHAVSVREASAVKLCEFNLGVAATCVVDPTLLLKRSDYEILIERVGESQSKGQVLSYVLDPEESKQSIAGVVGQVLGKSVFSVKPESMLSRVSSRELNKCIYPSVEAWLQAFRDSDFVVTDSFHGTVFAILFNKPFIAIGNPVRGMARFKSLLSSLGLEDRLVELGGRVTPEMIHMEVNWTSVNEMKDGLAEYGRAFIRDSLFGVKGND